MKTFCVASVTVALPGPDRIVRRIEPGGEVVTLARRSPVDGIDRRRVADRAVPADLRFVVAARVLPVGDMNDLVPVTVDVVGDGERAARCGCC